MLKDRLVLDRAQSSVGSELTLATPGYDRVDEVRRGLIQPVSGNGDKGLLGRLPETTHVAYLTYGGEEVRVGDVLGKVTAEGALVEAAEAGTAALEVSGLTVTAGADIEIGAAEGLERRRVAAVSGTTLTLEAALATAHRKNEVVRVVRRYLVVGVSDEAGQGHHLKIALRELVV
jgi:hypothetical protein